MANIHSLLHAAKKERLPPDALHLACLYKRKLRGRNVGIVHQVDDKVNCIVMKLAMKWLYDYLGPHWNVLWPRTCEYAVDEAAVIEFFNFNLHMVTRYDLAHRAANEGHTGSYIDYDFASLNRRLLESESSIHDDADAVFFALDTPPVKTPTVASGLLKKLPQVQRARNVKRTRSQSL